MKMVSRYFSNPDNLRFLKRLCLFALFFIPSVVFASQWFASNYYIHIDPQSEPCLPGDHLFIVDKHDQEVVRGGVYSITAEGIAYILKEADPIAHHMIPYYEDGKILTKVVDGLPGDHISISEKGVFINGKNMEIGELVLYKTLAKSKASFTKEFIVPEGYLYVSGRTEQSLDSRYWGLIKTSQIFGRARAFL